MAVENARLYVNLRRNYQRTVEMKNLLDDTFASIASGVVTIDTDGGITNINAAAQRCLGLTHAAALGRPYAALLPDQTAALEKRLRWQGRRPAANRRTAVGGSGRARGLVHLVLSVSPLKDGNQNTVGLTLVLDDVTERRQLEAERERIRQTFGRVVMLRVRDKLLSEPPNLAGLRQVVTTQT